MADVKLIGNSNGTGTTQWSVNTIALQKFAAIASGSLTTIKLLIDAFGGSPYGKVAIYADNSGNPGAFLVSTASQALVSDSLNSFSIGPVDVVAGTSYWLAFNSTGATCVLRSSTVGSVCRYKTLTYSSAFPNPAGTGYSLSTSRLTEIAGWSEETTSGTVVPLLMNQYRRRVA